VVQSPILSRLLSVLASRILDAQQQAQQKEQASTRKELVGSGDRSQRIRTYNYPQGRITEHLKNRQVDEKWVSDDCSYLCKGL
jgi:protein subunit release factor A